MKLKLAGASLNQTPIDWAANRRNVQQAIQLAKQDQVDLLCLPELCITGYGCQDLFLGDWIYEKAEQELEALLPLIKDFYVLIGLPAMVEGKRYNAALIAKNGRIEGITCKQFLANDGVHYEPRWFTPWEQGKETVVDFAGQKDVPVGDLVYDLNGVKTGIEICEDAWRSENRTGHQLIKRGAQLILNPSASHFAFGKTKTRESLVIPFSKQHNCTYLLVNLLGNEAGRMIYDGDMQLAQNGHLLYKNNRLRFNEVDYFSQTVDFGDPGKSEKTAITDKDEKYTEFTRAASLGLFDYLRKSKAKGFTLSISGGADSSTCAVLVAHMVKLALQDPGAEKAAELLPVELPEDWKTLTTDNLEKHLVGQLLTTVYQSTENSSEQTYEAARHLAESIGAKFYWWSVDEQVEDMTEKVEFVLGRKLKWSKDDIALQNIQSRVRSPGIWMLTNVKGTLLLTTSNRSESSTGYATMDGDTSGSLAPIAGVDKHFIRNWLGYAERELGYHGLEKVNALAPTAELRPADARQTDEDDLMPYYILTQIERLAIGRWKKPKDVFLELDPKIDIPDGQLKTYIARFFRLWSRNQWKRERYAPTFHLDDFNVDPKTWCRFPIISGGFDEEIKEMMKV